MGRKKLIAANWKMHKTPEDMGAFVRAFSETRGFARLRSEGLQAVIAMPAVLLPLARAYGLPEEVELAAQNMHHATQGAFTGELSGQMLLSVGVGSVVLGHSERRQYFAETDQALALKVQAALDLGLRPIFCVGEAMQERQSGRTEEVVARQLGSVLQGLRDPDQKLVIAYEPVWAIGTGLAATSEQANEVHGFIRSLLEVYQGKSYAESTRILYGGSVTPKNAQDLFGKPHIDGALIGGASLEAQSFAAIMEA